MSRKGILLLVCILIFWPRPEKCSSLPPPAARLSSSEPHQTNLSSDECVATQDMANTARLRIPPTTNSSEEFSRIELNSLPAGPHIRVGNQKD